jgi:hypothetical protein
MIMSEELRKDVERLNDAVFGDRDNMRENPGIISELRQMNATMTEVSGSMKRINWIVLTAFITALVALVIKGAMAI